MTMSPPQTNGNGHTETTKSDQTHILIHQTGLSDSRITQYDDLFHSKPIRDHVSPKFILNILALPFLFPFLGLPNSLPSHQDKPHTFKRTFFLADMVLVGEEVAISVKVVGYTAMNDTEGVFE